VKTHDIAACRAVPQPAAPLRALIQNDSQHNFSHHLKKSG